MNFPDSKKDLLERLSDIEKLLGYTFQDKELLLCAFVHRSFANENKHLVTAHNERLEFLGDTVLDLLISDYLYRSLPKKPEGELSHLRARLVEAHACTRYVYELKVEDFLLLGKGELLNQGQGRASILANLFEAILGAIFLDGKLEAAQDFLFSKLLHIIDELIENPAKNWKAELQDYTQKVLQKTPTYTVIEESGPDHKRFFRVTVAVDDVELGEGSGRTKKLAQQDAAANAIKTTLKDKS